MNKVKHLKVRVANTVPPETMRKLMLLRGNLVARELATRAEEEKSA